MLSTTQYCSDNEGVEKALVHGNDMIAQKNYELALQSYESALELFRQHEKNNGVKPTVSSSFTSTTLISIICYKIALAHFYLEHFEKALPFLEQSIDGDSHGYANACILQFNSLWKLNSCVQAIICVHDFLNRFPQKEQAIQAILNNLKNSKMWYMDPRIRIVKLSDDNYCVQAIENIPVEEVVRIFDENGEREEFKGVTIVKDSLVCSNQLITGNCSSPEESLITVGITIKQLLQHFDKFHNVLRGLHPRKIEHVPQSFATEWNKFFFENFELLKQNIGIKEEFDGLTLQELEALENDKERLTEVIRMTMVIKLNGFIGGVYGLACLFNHSCEENCEKIDEKIVTLKPIRKGDFLTLNYMGFDDYLANRRKYLLEHFAFECECTRCQREIMAGESLVVDPNDDIMDDEEEVTITEKDIE